jgi:hypothetical protein
MESPVLKQELHIFKDDIYILNKSRLTTGKRLVYHPKCKGDLKEIKGLHKGMGVVIHAETTNAQSLPGLQ